MMSVALMSGAGENEFFRFTEDGLPWSQARLGQSVLLVELIGHIQAIRRAHEAKPLVCEIFKFASSPTNYRLSKAFTNSIGETIRFVTSLETRIGILLDAKVNISRCCPDLCIYTLSLGAHCLSFALAKNAFLYSATRVQAVV